MGRISTGTLVVLAVLLLGLVTLGTALWGNYLAGKGPLAAPVTVVVEPGSGTAAIGRDLQAAGVIADARIFRAAVRAMHLDASLKAGEYAFEPGISLRAVVNKLALGDTRNRMVTIPEGWTVREVLARLEKVEGLTGKVVAPGEGRIFPDTYAFRFGTVRESLLASMEARMRDELNTAWNGRALNLPLGAPDELLTLASIVQKEAASEEEMPKIAGVFINRLRKGMRLQSDPTVIYGAEAYDGNIRHRDLRDENPFNTYVYAGLPPTPIANPGRAALMAAAHPEVTDALFFVADVSRTGHVFSATYGEHQRHVKALVRAPVVAPARAGISGTVQPKEVKVK
jgi:UPF0755 protein